MKAEIGEKGERKRRGKKKRGGRGGNEMMGRRLRPVGWSEKGQEEKWKGRGILERIRWNHDEWMMGMCS